MTNSTKARAGGEIRVDETGGPRRMAGRRRSDGLACCEQKQYVRVAGIRIAARRNPPSRVTVMNARID